MLTNSLFKVKGVPRVLHADLLLPRPEGRSRDRVPDPDLRGLDDPRPVAQQRVLLGDQPQPGPDAAARLVLEDGPGLRHRIPLRPRRGAPKGHALLQPAASTRRSTDDTTTPERQSYEIRGAGTQRISRAVRARFRADYFSDIAGAADLPPERVRRVAPPARLQRVGGRRLARVQHHRHGRSQRVFLRDDELHRSAAARRGC